MQFSLSTNTSVTLTDTKKNVTGILHKVFLLLQVTCKFIEIVILLVYYTIPFALRLF